MKPLSKSLSTVPASATMAVNNKAAALKAQGVDIVKLAGGDPDFDTPDYIQQAVFDAIRAGDTHYPSPAKGTAAATTAIADKFNQASGLEIDPNSQVIITPGGKWAIYLGLAAIINPGDEVIVLEPYWVSYPTMVEIVGGKPIGVTLSSEDNFAIRRELIEKAITPATKAIMVTSPNNPTGRVLTEDEAQIIVDLANEYDLYVIYDELYEQLIFDGGKHISLAGLDGMAERTITINGLSKAYAMTGWRLGWIIANPEIIGLAAKLHSQTITCASSFGMTALAAALTGDQSGIAVMRDAYQARRDFIVPALNAIDGIECNMIEGAFYIMPRFTKTRLNSEEIASALLDAGVAGTPGIAFGVGGEGHLRFAISTAMEELEKAVERLRVAVPRLP